MAVRGSNISTKSVLSRFPMPNTRVEGAAAASSPMSIQIPVESFDKISGGKTAPVILKPFGWPVFVLNTKQGLNSDIRIRKAIQAALAPNDMLLAAFGSKDFFAADAALYPEGYAWHTDAAPKRTSRRRHRGRGSAAEEAVMTASRCASSPAASTSPLQDGAGCRGVPQGAGFSGPARRRRMGDRLTKNAHRSGALGCLHHPQPVHCPSRR